MIDGSRDFLQSFSTNNNDDNNDKMDQYVCDGYHHEDGHGSVKWMPSKMRWMRKMVASEPTVSSKPRRSMENLQQIKRHNQDSSSNFPSGIIRVCSDCSTTKTPLWRSGPQGPKVLINLYPSTYPPLYLHEHSFESFHLSLFFPRNNCDRSWQSLCNACGIRQRKARRAAMAAATGSGLVATDTARKVQKEKRSIRDRAIPNKKRCKIDTTRTAQKKPQIDDIMMSLSNNSAFHRVFPQDETDAAILLMALSCGLVHG